MSEEERVVETVAASDYLNMTQFHDIHEMRDGDVGTVPTHALHDVYSVEYATEAKNIPEEFEKEPAPHYTEETMSGLQGDVGRHGIETPISVGREWSRYQKDPFHAIMDGSHRYLAALRNEHARVPVKMKVWPQQ